ncbi:RHS repeat domain-containing protein [Thauera sinica]|uniref:RHS repeat domain-containing protein n=1 Tax=Thauera sinica TaxID=2665146 RepID=A0ABW1AVW6_9RHOO
MARNQAGQVVWRWESDAFGSTAANADPAGTGTSTTVNLRLPGQYFDKESGLFYNWKRYYDPTIGRYISPDPIGIAGGLNLFGYAKQNPLRFIDPDDLSPDPLNSSGESRGLPGVPTSFDVFFQVLLRMTSLLRAQCRRSMRYRRCAKIALRNVGKSVTPLTKFRWRFARWLRRDEPEKHVIPEQMSCPASA